MICSASGGELFDRIVNHGAFKESETKIVFRQMVEAVGYLHSKDIVHRDLKVMNNSNVALNLIV